ncbi:MAG: hemagglutinin repeat-containing protein [Fusobacterium varium]|uniref:two-partner secretion domain-containing protein n=1 Tax=Fusobacterium varium TaxID=856 RepID=UPI00242AD666|nr:hemagglutinin repeat-containing protein [Fusobacterium varium]UYI77762.1 MAG: hemagglutinin repeat-containing protein [Fusobacterium varium]
MKNTFLRKFLIYIYIFFSTFIQPVIAASIVVDKNKNQQLNIDKAANGKPVININAPNKSGMSHNFFKEYNVEKEGIILNNSNKNVEKTQLAGYINGNPNLTNRKEADTILAEITGTSRSKLEGFTEIAGKQANFILSNPNGIYVNGAGFINTPRAILTTGRTILDKFGELKGFDVDDGTIVIGGSGIDVRNLTKFDIISRTAQLNGTVYGGDEVNIILGRNKYDLASKTAVAKEDTGGEKPKIALDGKALGSLYAGRIYIHSNEKGVGVNSQSSILADAEDVVIDVNGDLILKDVQAKRDINLKSENIAITEKAVSERNIKVDGKEIVNSGTLSANQDIVLRGKNFINEKETVAKNINVAAEKIENNGTIFGEEKLNIISKKIMNKNESVTAGSKANIEADDITNSGIILGDIVNVKSKEIANVGTISGKNTAKIISNVKNSGNIQGKNRVEIIGEINNDKNIKSEKELLISGSLYNQGYIYSVNSELNGKINNNGNLLSLTNMNILGNINNSNNLVSGDKLILLSENLENRGNISSKVIEVTGNILNNSNSITGETIYLNIGDIVNNETIYAESFLTIEGKSLVNNKFIQSLAGINIVSNNVNNIGDLFAKEDITVKTDDMTNAGKIISERIGRFETKNYLINNNIIQGNILELKDVENNEKLISEKNMKIDTLKNSGTVTALENIEINNTQNETTGKIVSGKDIIVKKSLENDGILSAKGNLSGISIKNSGNILSDKDILLKELAENKGVIEGSNINIINTGNINNDFGEIKVFNEESKIDITASNLTNNRGKIQSQGILSLNISEDLILAGLITGDKELSINAKSLVSNSDIENNGSITLKLEGNFVNNRKFVSGENIEITAGNLTNSGTLGSVKGFLANILGKLNNLKDIVLGSGKNEIVSNDEIKNSGFLTSQGDLILKSKNLINSGQIASGKELGINLSGNMVNNEDSLIYSNSNMDINAIGDVLNEKGEIYSGNNLIITTEGNVKNTIGDIESIGDITINASHMENIGEITGSHSIIYVTGGNLNLDTSTVNKAKLNAKSVELMNRLAKEYMKSNNWTWFHDGGGVYLYGGEKVVSNYTSNLSYLTAGKNLTLNIKNDIINREGNILAGNDINIDAKNLTNENFLKEITTKAEWRRDYELHGSAMYTLKYGAYYYDGQIYNHNRDKGNVIIKDDIIWKVGSDKATKISAGGNLNIRANKVGNGILANDKHTANKKNVNAGEVSLNENNIQKTGTIETEEYIKIPKGDKGLFKVNEEFTESGIFQMNAEKNLVNNNSKPGFSCLIETNVKFVDKGMFLGSEYFFNKINFNPEENIRLLGDEFFETKFVNRAILESTGVRYLNGATNDKEQMQILYDNSIKAMEDMNLSIGISLTAEQINNLKEDIIWYVEEEVNGVKVLVPKVYLSKETLASLGDNQSGLYAGDSLNISAVTVNNTGKIQSSGNVTINTEELLNKSVLGEYKAGIKGNNINIVSVGDISNIGAEIDAENSLNLESLKGNIANKTIYRENVLGGKKTVSRVENTASITGGNININAGENFENTGALVKAEENLNISAKDINLDTVEIYNYEKIGGGKNYTITESNKNFGGSIEGNNITLDAEKNINVKGSNVVAENNLNVKAGENVNITASVDTDYYEKQKSKKKSFGRSKSSTEVKYSTSHNSSNLIGENINIASGNNTSIIGSNIQAGTEGKAEINAGGDIIQGAVKDINYSYKKTTKKGFLGLTGSSKSTESYKEDAVKANTISGTGGTTYVADKGIMLEGVTVVSTGNVTLKGTDVSINPAEEKSFHEVKQKKKGFAGSISGGGISLSYGKSKDEIKTTATENIASNIVSQGKVTIEADGGKAELKSVDIYGSEGIDISGTKGVELTTAKNKTTVDEKHKSTSIGVNVGIQSSITNTVENIKNIDKLTDFGGNSYDIANTASDLVGAIKDGADAIGKIKPKVVDSNGNIASENLEGIVSTNVNDYISVSAGINKSKSESHSSDESSVKNKLESGGDINIGSLEGSVLIEGTDIKTEKDLNLKADKDIIVQSSKDEYNYSNKSSSSGISADLNISTDPSTILGGVTVSQNKGKGKGEGTANVNSKFEVGGTHRAEAGETVKYDGANVEAGRVEIKGEEVIISSSKDTGISNSENKGGSIKFTPLPSELNVNYNKGKGEKDWVSDQTSIIAKEGGTIESKDFTNSGAIIGSESEENKLIVKADNVTVESLKDKDTNKVSGGGISIKGAGVPGVSVITGGQDKRQDTNATAVNTEFIVKGENKTAEELGFNTDINKAQEITKDEDRVLDVDLHTDLLNKAERDKIAEAGDYLEAIYEGITDSGVGGTGNTIKEKIYGNILKKTAERYPGFVKLNEKTIDENGEILADKLNEKGNRTKDLLDFFAVNVGYEGKVPEILIGDLPPGEEAFAAPDHNTIVIDRKVLASADSDKVLSLLAHELGHFNSYDSNTESTAKRMENTVSGAVSQKEATAKYEENFQKKYAGKDISGSEAQKIIDSIPEENREKVAVSDSSNNIAGAFLGRVNIGATQYYVIDTKIEKGSEVKTYDIGIGLGTPSLGGSVSMVILPHANSSKDIAGHFRVIGGSISIFGGEILLDSNNNFMGLKYSIGVTPNAVPAGEVHLGADSSIVRNVENIKVTNEMIKLSKEIEDLSITGESASKNVGRINILSTKLLMEIRKNNSKGDKK